MEYAYTDVMKRKISLALPNSKYSSKPTLLALLGLPTRIAHVIPD
jgi:hypothetical protein